VQVPEQAAQDANNAAGILRLLLENAPVLFKARLLHRIRLLIAC
jgi:hypothetical protein